MWRRDLLFVDFETMRERQRIAVSELRWRSLALEPLRSDAVGVSLFLV